MIEGQTSIFEMIYPAYKITKPIRLIELFAGYGSQALALKYLGVPFEHWKICEWAVKSIQAYKDIHFNGVDIDINKTKEEMVDFLYQKGISQNYNDPMTKQQISRLNEKQLQQIVKNIEITHNLVNIQQVKGNDLCIKDTDKFTYLLTYSFPCQDLSLAGNRKGMSDTTTRSGLLWEVERILTELEEKPQVLLMENVPQVHSEGAIEDFNKWQLRLEELGYKNYWKDLIATDFGIPQTRNRCFMVSILGDYNYTFPKPIPLKLKLKDMLEDEVDEKYYLSDKMKQYIFSEDDKYKVNKGSLQLNREIACSKTTREGNTRADTSDYITNMVKIKNANSKGYLEATVGDGVDISGRMQYHRGTVQKDKTQTLSTVGGENNGVVVLGNYSPSNHEASRIIDPNYVAPTFKENHNTINAIQQTDLRIRKLTPRECGRLMGLKDEDIDKILENQSDSSAYHLFGDSIVIDVLIAIFREMI